MKLHYFFTQGRGMITVLKGIFVFFQCVLLFCLFGYLTYQTLYITRTGTDISADTANIAGTKAQVRNPSNSFTHDDLKQAKTDEPDLIKDQIFWSEYAESFVPKGLSREQSIKRVMYMRNHVVTFLSRGNSRNCGDSKNAVALLPDKTGMCVRYSQKQLQIYAEVLAFYLSRMLNMDNVPEVLLASSNSSSPRWKEVNVTRFRWGDNVILSLIRKIPGKTTKIRMPEILRQAYLNGQTVTSSVIRALNTSNMTEIADLIQWGTLIVYDSLTGPYDRLYLVKSGRPEFTGTLNNAFKSSIGKIWLFDHEKTLIYYNKNRGPVYNFTSSVKFHDIVLKTLCVFQSTFVDGLRVLSKQPSPFITLWNYSLSQEPLLDTMTKDHNFKVCEKWFNKRLTHILQWIEQCNFIDK